MHFEILVEDLSGQNLLTILVPKIIGEEHTYKIHSYKGIGHIPRNLGNKPDPSIRHLFNQLPKLLQGYGRVFASYPDNYRAAVIIVCDLDKNCMKGLRRNLLQVLNTCDPRPLAQFCFAIEEIEAWLLGDIAAVRKAYPAAKNAVLNQYKNDSLCGTWECLADAVYKGGADRLSVGGSKAIGYEKSMWVNNIGPHMDISRNSSPSFNYFKNKLQDLASRQ